MFFKQHIPSKIKTLSLVSTFKKKNRNKLIKEHIELRQNKISVPNRKYQSPPPFIVEYLI